MRFPLLTVALPFFASRETMKKIFSHLFSTWEKCVSLKCGNFYRTTHIEILSGKNKVLHVFDGFNFFFLNNYGMENNISSVQIICVSVTKYSTWMEVL